MGIDDQPPQSLCSVVADGVTRNIVRLFREPDAGNLPVRFDERGQETGPSQTGLRWRGESQVEISTGRLKLLRLFSTLLAISPSRGVPRGCRWSLAVSAVSSFVPV